VELQKKFPVYKYFAIVKNGKGLHRFMRDRICNIEINKENCPCTYEYCDKKGVCCECLRYHLSRRELPACCFPPEVEKTYDRSFERFIEVYSKM